jgi:hypothetical protein
VLLYCIRQSTDCVCVRSHRHDFLTPPSVLPAGASLVWHLAGPPSLNNCLTHLRTPSFLPPVHVSARLCNYIAVHRLQRLLICYDRPSFRVVLRPRDPRYYGSQVHRIFHHTPGTMKRELLVHPANLVLSSKNVLLQGMI